MERLVHLDLAGAAPKAAWLAEIMPALAKWGAMGLCIGWEDAIRFFAIDRKVTQGTQEQCGREWSGRNWTATATCAQQGRSPFRYLVDALDAHFHGCPAPCLIA